MPKKEDRLSPKARKLLEDARKIDNPKESADYLMSVKPRELNRYDREKIGREILARIKYFPSGDWWQYRRMSKEDVQREKDNEYVPNKKLRLKTEGDEEFSNAQRLEKQAKEKSKEIVFSYPSKDGRPIDEPNEALGSYHHLMADTIMKYIHAGETYRKVGMTTKAIESYNKAIECIRKERRNEASGWEWHSPQEGWRYSPSRQKIAYSDEMYESEKGIKRVNVMKGEIRKMKSKSGGLEGKTAATTAIVGLIGGLFFLSSNVTGNVIGLNQSTGNILGAVLLVVGLLGSFFWFRSHKK